MKKTKISLIGAGSGCFSLGLIRELGRSKVLSNCTVSLMDINEERLNAVHNLCVRYTKEVGGSLEFETTTDRAESLKGADFVINTALAAPHHRLQEGWKIAEKYGFRFAGSYHVMYDEAFWINFYQFRLMEEITRDILTYCPNAWHLMVANPMVAGTTLLQRKYPQAKMVGLCHGYAMCHHIAQDLGFDKDAIHYQMPGVNHFVWMNQAHLNGEPFFPYLDKWLEEKSEKFWENKEGRTGYAGQVNLSRKRMDFYKTHGVIGIGDTMSWTGASWPWWYHTDEATEKKFDLYPAADGWNYYFREVKENAQNIIDMANDPNASVSDFLANVEDDNLMVPLVEAIACDIPRVLIVNLLNKGQLVPGLPEDFEVEVHALCNGDGVHPIATTPLPKSIIAHTLRDRVAPVEMELAAYESGDINLLRELVLMDKWATSMEQVSAFIDEILDLPYHKEMKEHFKR